MTQSKTLKIEDTGKQNIPPNLPTATELGNNKGICN